MYALLVGPTRAAFASRRGLSPILANRFTAWILALAILVLVILITPGTGVQTWIGRATLLVLLIVGVERLHALVRARASGHVVVEGVRRGARTGSATTHRRAAAAAID